MKNWARRLTKALRGYLMLTGLLAHVAALVAVVYLLRHYEVTPRQAAVAVLKRAGIQQGPIYDLFLPSPRYADHKLDGRVRRAHPRILFPEVAGKPAAERLEWFRQRGALYSTKQLSHPCGSGDIVARAACWLMKGDAGTGRRALAAILDSRVETPAASGKYGNGWRIAIAYDLLHDFEGWQPSQRARVEQKLRQALKKYLLLLDGDSASLWHGRATLAAEAWITAVAMDRRTPEDEALRRRAQGHFLDTVRAMELTGAWPEGYNYWINNRAYKLAMAGAAYLNGLQGARKGKEVAEALRRAAYWNLYGTRPDDRMEALGDEGPRVDLKDETRRFIDLVAQLTDDRLLAGYSRYLAKLHGRESYYRGYRWGFQLLNDPRVAPMPGMEDGDLESLGVYLPKATLFGPRWFNLAFIRSGWDRDATFISFRAGKSFTHHGHYDAGHFTLFKGAPLAINSGTYGPFISEHRLHYAIRTVAKNSLLVLRPGEKVHPNRFFDKNVAAGGQRITLPTGSAITSTRDWAEKLHSGPYLDAGSVAAFDHEPGDYSYIRADLTAAYNTPQHDEGGSGGKVERVQRELLYLEPEDRLILFDRVTTVRPDYLPKWLLHTITRPEAEGLKVLKGKADNGILETNAGEVRVSNGRGRLRIDVLWPRQRRVRLLGGPDYRFYVESDGDDSDLNGENMVAGMNLKSWFDAGNWRIEVQPAQPHRRNEFLVVLTPDIDDFRSETVHPIETADASARGLSTRNHLVLFGVTPGRPLRIRSEADKQLLLPGLEAGQRVRLRAGGKTLTLTANDQGVVTWPLGGAGERLVIEVEPSRGA